MPKRKVPASSSRPKDIAAGIAARKPLDRAKFDQEKLARANQRTISAADRLLEEMAAVLRNLDRKH